MADFWQQYSDCVWPNHLTTVLVLPGIALLFVSKSRDNAQMLRVFALGTVCFLAVAGLLYSYLYLRAQQVPLFNWGDPSTLSNLWKHISGDMYSQNLFESTAVTWANFKLFIEGLPGEVTYPGLLVIAFGAYQAFRIHRAIALFLVVNIVANVGFAINYNIPDLNPLYILSYISMSGFFMFGLSYLLELLPSHKIRLMAPLLGCAIPAMALWSNYSTVDQSDNFMQEDYITSALNSVDSNAIVLAVEFENDISPAMYFQTVEKVRPDVVMVDYKTLIGNQWYADQLDRKHPGLFDPVRDQFNRHRVALEGYNYRVAKERAAVRAAFIELTHSLLRHYHQQAICVYQLWRVSGLSWPRRPDRTSV